MRTGVQNEGYHLATSVVLTITSLGGCGTTEWPDRPMTVRPGSFVVHEDALLSTTPRKSNEGTGLPQACSAPMMKLQVHPSCEASCGPIRVARGETLLATLLGPEVRRASTVDPERIERAYATPPVDGSRTTLALVSGAGSEATYTVESRCALTAKSGGGPPPTNEGDHKLLIRPPSSCGYLVEVSCR